MYGKEIFCRCLWLYADFGLPIFHNRPNFIYSRLSIKEDPTARFGPSTCKDNTTNLDSNLHLIPKYCRHNLTNYHSTQF